MSGQDDMSLLEDLESPSKVKARSQSRSANNASSAKTSQESGKTHEDALRQELGHVKKVNETIEGLLTSLQKAQANMKVGW